MDWIRPDSICRSLKAGDGEEDAIARLGTPRYVFDAAIPREVDGFLAPHFWHPGRVLVYPRGTYYAYLAIQDGKIVRIYFGGS